MRTIGILLILFGVFALAFGGIRYTQREKVLDTPHLDAYADRERTVPFAPITGVVALLGGLVLVAVSKDKL